MGYQKNKPEFIMVDDEDLKNYKEEFLNIIERLPKGLYPLSYRLMMIVLAGMMLIVSLFFLGLFIVNLILSLITLFKLPLFSSNIGKLWFSFRRMACIFVGSFVAIFSPPFGVGIMLLYFIMFKDKTGRDIFEKFYVGSINLH